MTNVEAQHQCLLRPDSYPDETGPISFIQTHISRLYLSNRHVYKLKKPVNYGFLDFTTLEKRLHFCQEEIRLNNRACPDTYLGVVEVRKNANDFHIGGNGDIVDYAVMMNRLPEKRMLDKLIAKNDSSLPYEMQRLAEQLVELHNCAKICHSEAVDARGIVQQNWQENLAQTEPFIGNTICAASYRQVGSYLTRFFAKNSQQLTSRQTNGYVREVHGDLHAEHICLTDPIRIYDCIEFNSRFRTNDLADDLAFLLMDLDFRNRRDLGEILLQTYQHLTELDFPVDLLKFFKIYRAWVRGKVESLLSQDATVNEVIHRHSVERAQQYFNLAIGYLCRPTLIITCGLMGVGKTTISTRLAHVMGGRLLRSDLLRKEITSAGAESKQTPFGAGIYNRQVTEQTYRLLQQKTHEALAENKSVIVDASFIHQNERRLFRTEAELAGIPFVMLHMQCSEDLSRQRLNKRKAAASDVSDGRWELYHQQADIFETFADTDRIITIDTTKNVNENVCQILSEMVRIPTEAEQQTQFR